MTTEFEWSAQQLAAAEAIKEWYHHGDRQTFLLEGFAGTGKTTLIRKIGDGLGIRNVVFASFTGKAAAVMQAKGCTDACTIHSLIYQPEIAYSCARVPPCPSPPCGDAYLRRCPHVRERAISYTINPTSNVAGADLVVIDEISMVGPELGRDLLSFGTKILVLGDRNQLPPIGDGGFFTNREPDFRLTEIHRQAAGSPIVALATKARLDIALQIGSYGTSAVVSKRDSRVDLREFDQIICGKHDTRGFYNRQMRGKLGFRGDVPNPGEKIICLKNCKAKGLLNGTLWNVVRATPDRHGFFYNMVIKDDAGRLVEVRAPAAAFGMNNHNGGEQPGEPFDFGYCITCHKSQGSQWNSVAVIDESFLWRRDNQHTNWAYTAITRAAERVCVMTDHAHPAALLGPQSPAAQAVPEFLR
jgi:exodeoxyribonuclease V